MTLCGPSGFLDRGSKLVLPISGSNLQEETTLVSLDDPLGQRPKIVKRKLHLRGEYLIQVFC